MTEEIKTIDRKLSIYEKLSNARYNFHKLKLKKSGENKYAGYKYFELGDFLPQANECLHLNGLFAFVSFGAEVATIKVVEFDGDSVVEIVTPMSSASLKGCHDVQNLGAVETYLRRYLWVALMEVVENDIFDNSELLKEEKPVSYEVKKEQNRINKLKRVEPNTDSLADDVYYETYLTDEEKVLNSAKEVGVEKDLVYKWQSEHVRKPSWKIISSRLNTFKREIKAFADAQNFK